MAEWDTVTPIVLPSLLVLYWVWKNTVTYFNIIITTNICRRLAPTLKLNIALVCLRPPKICSNLSGNEQEASEVVPFALGYWKQIFQVGSGLGVFGLPMCYTNGDIRISKHLVNVLPDPTAEGSSVLKVFLFLKSQGKFVIVVIQFTCGFLQRG